MNDLKSIKFVRAHTLLPQIHIGEINATHAECRAPTPNLNGASRRRSFLLRRRVALHSAEMGFHYDNSSGAHSGFLKCMCEPQCPASLESGRFDPYKHAS